MTCIVNQVVNMNSAVKVPELSPEQKISANAQRLKEKN